MLWGRPSQRGRVYDALDEGEIRKLDHTYSERRYFLARSEVLHRTCHRRLQSERQLKKEEMELKEMMMEKKQKKPVLQIAEEG